uniref:DPPIV_N domain-containing protein n=1 Tax=Steinernema glaseri TaxID=37863 RepID=A0A1I7Y999_9BILA
MSKKVMFSSGKVLLIETNLTYCETIYTTDRVPLSRPLVEVHTDIRESPSTERKWSYFGDVYQHLDQPRVERGRATPRPVFSILNRTTFYWVHGNMLYFALRRVSPPLLSFGSEFRGSPSAE